MTTVQQPTDSLFKARATKRNQDGRWSVDITGEGSSWHRITAEPRHERYLEECLDDAVEDAGFYRTGAIRHPDGETVEVDVLPITPPPAPPAWATAPDTGKWESRELDGLSKYFERHIGGGATITQEVFLRGGQIQWGAVEVLDCGGQGFMTPEAARAAATSLLTAADEAERIIAAMSAQA